MPGVVDRSHGRRKISGYETYAAVINQALNLGYKPGTGCAHTAGMLLRVRVRGPKDRHWPSLGSHGRGGRTYHARQLRCAVNMCSMGCIMCHFYQANMVARQPCLLSATAENHTAGSICCIRSVLKNSVIKHMQKPDLTSQ